MVDLQTISLIVQMVGVSATATAAVVGVSSYINSNRRAEEAKRKEQDTREMELKTQQQNLETRQAQMFMNIYQQVSSPEFLKAWQRIASEPWRTYAEWERLYRDDMSFREAEDITQFFYEGLGTLVREGLLPIRMVALLMCGATRYHWERHVSMVEEGRRATGHRRWFSEEEYLYGELLKYLGEHPELDTRAESPPWEKGAR